MTIQEAIQKAVDGGWGLIVFPKRATIVVCRSVKNILRGIKVGALNLYKSVMLAVFPIGVSFSPLSTTTTPATGTITTLNSTDVFKAIQKLESDFGLPNLNGLANELGITKEGVQRLIWLLEGARDTSNGSEPYSSETISLVKNALLKERILKLTTIPLDLRPLLTKSKLQPTTELWSAHGYGMKVMGAHSAVNATEI